LAAALADTADLSLTNGRICDIKYKEKFGGEQEREG
jgi:hypothetical protein